jgi:uncharacterized protein YgbK (DUF1537 family)
MLYTFYGDDFTGSTDVLEQLASNNILTVLFLGPPTPEHLANFKNIQALGIAGDSRSRSPQWMTEHLPSIFTTLKSFKAPINHYKVCSTFDSAPHIGSIGRAMEIGREIFAPSFIPIVVAAPHLRRYVIFGNLFAQAPNGEVVPIDRHPMSQHPVTPMREPNLRLHLRSQTQLPIGLIDLLALQSNSAPQKLEDELAAGNQAILFDGLDPEGPHQPTLTATGDLFWHHAQQRPLFSASSSGLTAALIPAWRKAGLIPTTAATPPRSSAKTPLLVLSGSCSPVTAGQIQWATANNFKAIPIDPTRLLNPTTNEQANALAAATASLNSGQNTILYTSLGPPTGTVHGDALGATLGHLLRDILLATPTRRILLCGGDTSSHAIQQLGLYALTWTSRIQTGAPLCRAASDDPALDGLELILKGGQVGTPDFFQAAHEA